MSDFLNAFEDLVKVEGGYADHPNDKGGETFCGIIGNMTLKALKSNRDLDFLYKAMNVLQGYHYISLVEKDTSQQVFIRGWFKRVFER